MECYCTSGGVLLCFLRSADDRSPRTGIVTDYSGGIPLCGRWRIQMYNRRGDPHDHAQGLNRIAEGQTEIQTGGYLVELGPGISVCWLGAYPSEFTHGDSVA